jgi:hypothetical protein
MRCLPCKQVYYIWATLRLTVFGKTCAARLFKVRVQASCYRQFLYMQGMTHQKGATRTETFQQHAQDVLDHGGKLTLPELLHCRVSYFSDGLVLGSHIFVQDVFNAHREEFGPKRRNGPRPIRQAALPTLFALRDLRKAPITPPGYLRKAAPRRRTCPPSWRSLAEAPALLLSAALRKVGKYNCRWPW